VLAGTVHDIDMPIIENDITVADGFVVHAWTFGGQVPGPTIRVHLGDTVNPRDVRFECQLHSRGRLGNLVDASRAWRRPGRARPRQDPGQSVFG
jgi:nitrite reductase (NO-forming)